MPAKSWRTATVFGGGFSISLWLKTSAENFFAAWSQANPGCLGTAMFGYGGGVQFQVYTGDGEMNGGPGSVGAIAPDVIDGNWHHIVCVKSGRSVFIYKDGELADAASSDYDIAPAPAALMLFDNCTSPGQTFYGSLDEFGIWQRALSAAEVCQLYNHGNGLACESF